MYLHVRYIFCEYFQLVKMKTQCLALVLVGLLLVASVSDVEGQLFGRGRLGRGLGGRGFGRGLVGGLLIGGLLGRRFGGFGGRFGRFRRPGFFG